MKVSSISRNGFRLKTRRLSITSAFSDPVDHRAALFVYGDKARNLNFPARESEHVTFSPEVLNLLERRMAGKPAGPDIATRLAGLSCDSCLLFHPVPL
jgi:hypothetical protein